MAAAALAVSDTPDGRRVLALSGRLDANTIRPLWDEAHRALAEAPTRPVTVDAARVDYCDGAGMALLVELVAHPRAAPVEVRNLSPANEVLFKQFDPARLEHDLDPAPPRRPVIEEIGHTAAGIWRDMRNQVTFIGESAAALGAAVARPHEVRWRDVWRICERVGADGLPIVALIAFLLGLILAFQSAVPMRRFGAEIFVADLVGIAMIRELGAALAALAPDTEVRVIVLAAEGKAFSAGHDLSEMGAERSVEELRALFASCSELMLAIQRQPQPVIARVQGVATAAGCQLVAMCDLAIASNTARFAVSGINLGLFCSTPSVALARNVPRKAALEMLLTGDFIDAATARERGLVNRVVAPELLDEEIARLVASIAAKSPAAVAQGKRLFYQQLELGIEAAYARAGEVMACNAVEPDARRGIAAFTKRG